MKIVNWSVEWATPRSPHWREILRRLKAHEPEVACLTEAGLTTVPWEGHVVCSLPDQGTLGVIDNVHEERRLSDHFGVFADLHAAAICGDTMSMTRGGERSSDR